MKLDFKKELKHLYNSSAKQVTIVDVPPMNFLMVDGEGNPNTAPQFQQSTEALYSLSYTLKFSVKKEKTVDYAVGPLEGIWWADDMDSFTLGEREKWKWTLMIMQPEVVTRALVDKALEQVRAKKDLPLLAKVRFESVHEGLSAQIMHIGPYSAEGPTVEKLHTFIKENGYQLRGRHREIYLGDPRRSAPEKLKTIIRHPVKAV